MMDKRQWETLLEPAAKAFAAFDHVLYEMVASASDEELSALAEAVTYPDQANSWWATYRAAKLLRAEIDGEQYRRRTAAAESA